MWQGGNGGGKTSEQLGRLRLTLSLILTLYIPSCFILLCQVASAFSTFEVLTRQMLIQKK